MRREPPSSPSHLNLAVPALHRSPALAPVIFLTIILDLFTVRIAYTFSNYANSLFCFDKWLLTSVYTFSNSKQTIQAICQNTATKNKEQRFYIISKH